MKAKKPILFPLKKRHGEFEFESSMRGSAHKIQKNSETLCKFPGFLDDFCWVSPPWVLDAAAGIGVVVAM